MFRRIPEFNLYEMNEDKVIRHIKTKNIKSPHRGGDSVRLYTEEGKELSRKIDKLFNLTFPEKVPGKFLSPFTKYRILDNGDIYSMHEAKVLKPAKTKDGYLTVSLQVGDTKEYKSVLVHRLVAQVYVSFNMDLAGLEVNHLDGNKENNHWANLEWCSKSGNMQHAYDNDLKTPLYRECVITSEEETKEFGSLKAAADYLGVTTGAVTTTVRKNFYGLVPSRGYGRKVGKYTCKGYIIEYKD